jgi:hypothetical protein
VLISLSLQVNIKKSGMAIEKEAPHYGRFVFCGKANKPTLNHIAMTEDLASGHLIPLGKYLIGSVYHMLRQTTFLMHTSQKIACVNGPWWFVQMWLQLYMHQIIGIDLNNRRFPSSNYKEGEIQVTK